MKKLSPQQRLIVDYLANGQCYCMASATFYMKDDRTRISELRKQGYELESKPCDGRCKTKHTSTLFMRRLASKPNVPQVRLVDKPDGTRVAQLF